MTWHQLWKMVARHLISLRQCQWWKIQHHWQKRRKPIIQNWRKQFVVFPEQSDSPFDISGKDTAWLMMWACWLSVFTAVEDHLKFMDSQSKLLSTTARMWVRNSFSNMQNCIHEDCRKTFFKIPKGERKEKLRGQWLRLQLPRRLHDWWSVKWSWMFLAHGWAFLLLAVSKFSVEASKSVYGFSRNTHAHVD